MSIDGDVKVPIAGPVSKKIVIGTAIAAGVYLVWRWYSARQLAAATAADPNASGDFGIGSAIPDTLGGVSTGGVGGNTDTTQTSTTSQVTTNGEWTQLAESLLPTDRWTETDIVTALGNYLNRRPQSTQDQAIIQAAIAVAGYPPVGSYSIIPGGNTAVLIAPTGVHVVSTTANQVTLGFNPVAGVTDYNVYRKGVASTIGTGAGSPITVGGLAPNTSYTLDVHAVSASGQIGPASSQVTAKTKAAPKAAAAVTPAKKAVPIPIKKK